MKTEFCNRCLREVAVEKIGNTIRCIYCGKIVKEIHISVKNLEIVK